MNGPARYPAEFERTWQTADGTRVAIRPLRPDDLEREVTFVEGLSPETRRLRLQHMARGVNREDLKRILDLDYCDRLALGALVPADTCETLIGVSRYARIEDSDRAEFAIVVTDDWQGRGIGTELLRSLAQGAHANGIRWLVGDSLAENQRILGWARRFGFDARTEPDSGGLVRVTLDLASLAP